MTFLNKKNILQKWRKPLPLSCRPSSTFRISKRVERSATGTPSSSDAPLPSPPRCMSVHLPHCFFALPASPEWTPTTFVTPYYYYYYSASSAGWNWSGASCWPSDTTSPPLRSSGDRDEMRRHTAGLATVIDVPPFIILFPPPLRLLLLITLLGARTDEMNQFSCSKFSFFNEPISSSPRAFQWPSGSSPTFLHQGGVSPPRLNSPLHQRMDAGWICCTNWRTPLRQQDGGDNEMFSFSMSFFISSFYLTFYFIFKICFTFLYR